MLVLMDAPPIPTKDEIVYIFTTGANSKPTYRRGILDLLTYPTGHVQQFSYRRSDIRPSVNQLLSSPTEKKAVVVFVDMDPQALATYVPLRWVNILEILPPLVSDRGYDPEERVKFFLEIGNYVEYQRSEGFRQWHQHLSSLDANREVKAGRATYFVVSGPNIFSAPQASGLLSWENLVTSVSHSSRFRDAIFLRLNHLRTYGEEQAEIPLCSYSHGPRSYLLRPGQAYQLDFDVFANPKATRSQKDSGVVTLTCSSELVEVTKPFQSVVSGLVQQSVILSCKRTIEETGAALSVEIGEPVEGVVNTPSPVLFLQMSISRSTLWTFVVLVFLGGLLVSLDKETMATISCSPALFIWLAKLLGSVCLARAAFLAFRKLPSGQG
jgi:hypothetical protein